MIELVTIPLFALFSRIWGGGCYFEVKDSRKLYDILRKICQFSYGAIAGFILTQDWVVALVCSLLFWLGEKPNWTPLINEVSGLVPQRKYLAAAMGIRGLVWASLINVFALILWFTPLETHWELLAFNWMIVAFPLAAYWGYRWQQKYTQPDDRHAFMEWSRGGLFACFLIVTLTIIKGV